VSLEQLTVLLRAASRLRVDGEPDGALVEALVEALSRLILPQGSEGLPVKAAVVAEPSPLVISPGGRIVGLGPSQPTRVPPAPPAPDQPRAQAPASRRRKRAGLRGRRSWLELLKERADLDVPSRPGVGVTPAAMTATEAPQQAPLESLFAAGRVRAILRELATRRQRTGDVDVTAAVALIARGEPIARLPRRLLSSLGHTVQMLFDGGPSMLPFARDKQQLLASATRVIGRDRLRAADFIGTPLDGIRAQRQVRWDAMRWPDRRSAVVVVSDLGIGDADVDLRSETWTRFCREAETRGLRTFALIPYPRDRWPAAATAFGTPLTWDIATGVQALHRSRRLRRER
jgi:hypothetical protein